MLRTLAGGFALAPREGNALNNFEVAAYKRACAALLAEGAAELAEEVVARLRQGGAAAVSGRRGLAALQEELCSSSVDACGAPELGQGCAVVWSARQPPPMPPLAGTRSRFQPFFSPPPR